MDRSIKKAVIPCGGLGTRFLPITKAVAKEMLPIIDRPCIDYIVDELIESGIEEICIVVSPGKDEIERYYSESPTLVARLERTGRTALADDIRRLSKKARFSYVVQDEARGSGDAILRAEAFADGQPFVVANGDDVMHAAVPVAKQLIDVYECTGKTVLGVQRRALPEILSYGVIDIKSDLGGGAYLINGILEKPRADELTSDLATLGRYVVDPCVFDVLRRTPIAANGELQFTDALNLIARGRGAVAQVFTGQRYDMGNKLGSVKAVVEYALRDAEYGAELRTYLKELLAIG